MRRMHAQIIKDVPKNDDSNVPALPAHSINQSIKGPHAKPHTGRGEATSQHHHRGGKPCITKHKVMQA